VFFLDQRNGEVLFDRPKPTAGCSANGRRRRSLYLGTVFSPYVCAADIDPGLIQLALSNQNTGAGGANTWLCPPAIIHKQIAI